MPKQWTVEHGDAISCLDRLPNASVDLVCTDPPYDSLEKYRKQGTTTRLKVSKASSNHWFGTVDDSYFKKWFISAARVLKPGRHLYVMANQDALWKMKELGEATVDDDLKRTLQFHKMIIWDKMTIGMGYHYRCQYEAILFFSRRGAKDVKLNDLGIPDVLAVKRLKGKPPEVYPTQKPVSLMSILITQSTQPGDLVVDPFLGAAATTARAALKYERRFWGVELDDKYHKLAVRRLTRLSFVERRSS